jgi:uncharacterized protein
MAAVVQQSTPLPIRSRIQSACELLLGAAIVIAHNVFRAIPNEVPILVVLGLASVRLRHGDWTLLGFKRPASWRWVLILAISAAAIRIVLGELVVEPIATSIWRPVVLPSVLEKARGSGSAALWAFLFIWTFAAFGEEISYR